MRLKGHPRARSKDGRATLQPRGLGEVDCEPVAFALVAAGHFGAGVAEMPLDVGFLDLRGGREAGAQRMAAEGEPPLALGQVAPQAGGESACLYQAGRRACRSAAFGSDAAILARYGPEEGPAGDARRAAARSRARRPGRCRSARPGRSRPRASPSCRGWSAGRPPGRFRPNLSRPRSGPGPQSRPTISDRRSPPAKPSRQDRPVTQASQVHVERRQHRQKLVGEDRRPSARGAAVAAADAGEHGGDMPVPDIERLARLAVAPGDARQPPLGVATESSAPPRSACDAR